MLEVFNKPNFLNFFSLFDLKKITIAFINHNIINLLKYRNTFIVYICKIGISRFFCFIFTNIIILAPF